MSCHKIKFFKKFLSRYFESHQKYSCFKQYLWYQYQFMVAPASDKAARSAPRSRDRDERIVDSRRRVRSPTPPRGAALANVTILLKCSFSVIYQALYNTAPLYSVLLIPVFLYDVVTPPPSGGGGVVTLLRSVQRVSCPFFGEIRWFFFFALFFNSTCQPFRRWVSSSIPTVASVCIAAPERSSSRRDEKRRRQESPVCAWTHTYISLPSPSPPPPQ